MVRPEIVRCSCLSFAQLFFLLTGRYHPFPCNREGIGALPLCIGILRAHTSGRLSHCIPKNQRTPTTLKAFVSNETMVHLRPKMYVIRCRLNFANVMKCLKSKGKPPVCNFTVTACICVTGHYMTLIFRMSRQKWRRATRHCDAYWNCHTFNYVCFWTYLPVRR